MKKFAERLIELRNHKKLTVEEVACNLCVSVKTYMRYEQGVTRGKISFLIRAMDFYNVSAEYLLGRGH